MAAESGQPRLVNSAAAPHSLIANPLVARGELKGVLCLYRLGPQNLFTEEEFQTAIRFSLLAALAIDNADVRSKLESLAMSDHLTGLYNHRYFQERLLEEVSRANRHQTSVSLVIFDIDDFKNVNDSYGHLLGDQVIQGVASSASGIGRIEDPVFRIGGEEFAFILPGQPGTQAQILAERIRRAVQELSFPMNTRVTVSLGLAEAPMNASSPRDLFACADLALRTAKAQGKNRVCAYDGGTLRPRRNSSNDHPLSGRWQILTEGSKTSRPRPSGSELSDSEAGPARMMQTRSIAQIELLHRLSSSLEQLHDVARIAELISADLMTSTECRTCRVYLLTDDGETVVETASSAIPQAHGDGAENHADGFDQAIASKATRSGQTMYLSSNSLFQARTQDGSHLIQSLLAAPMHFDHKVMGAIVLSKLGINQFDQEDIRLLETLASIAAIAFQNARLFEARGEAARTLGGA